MAFLLPLPMVNDDGEAITQGPGLPQWGSGSHLPTGAEAAYIIWNFIGKFYPTSLMTSVSDFSQSGLGGVSSVGFDTLFGGPEV